MLEDKTPSYFRRVIPLLISSLVLTFCTWISLGSLKQANSLNQEHFNNIVNQTKKSILERYTLYEAHLIGGLGLFNASALVDRIEWEEYVRTLDIEKNLPGISGLGFIEYVRDGNLEYFLEAIRSNDYPQFKYHPETEFPDKFIIKYIAPQNTNDEAVGLDIGFEENRRLAAESARDTGLPQITKRISLVQDKDNFAGFLVLVPFYKSASKPTTLAERRESLAGWVYAPFNAPNFFSQLNSQDNHHLDFEVYDGSSSLTHDLIYKSATPSARNDEFSKSTTIVIAGNEWTIYWQAGDNFAPVSSKNIYYYLLLLGLLLSIFLFILLRSLLSRQSQVQKLVQEKTKELRESQKFSHLIMNTIPDGISVKNRNLEIVRTNDVYLNYFPPENRDKVIGQRITTSFSGNETEKFLKQDKVAFENGFSQSQDIITIYTGEVKNLLTTKVKFHDDDGTDHILCISRDITDLISIQKNLEKEVQKRTQEYKDQKEIAEKAGNAKEEFLANMSHELRTPLNSIIGLIQIMINDKRLDDKQTNMINIVEKASNRLLLTVNEILDISKIESGNIELESTTFNLIHSLYTLVEQSRPLASQKGIQLTDNLNNLTEIYINGDEHRISSVIMNIISNAIKYTDVGSVDIAFNIIEKNTSTIDFTCIVSDTGIGIAKDQLESIFDKFSQAEKSTERLYGGTGLGLNIAKELVSLMKGEVTVESTVGSGSVFKIRIPFLKANSDVESQNRNLKSIEYNCLKGTGENKKFEIKNIKILVAEDHEFNQIFIDEFLNRLGSVNHKIVSNGALAFEEFKAGHYDLILMDCNMPVLDGYKTSEKIRRYEDENGVSGNRVFISAMTADVMSKTKQRCLNAGMNEYLTKPLNQADFKNKMNDWIIFQPEEDINVPVYSKQQEIISHVDVSTIIEYFGNNLDRQREIVSVFHESSLEDLENIKMNVNNYNNNEWVVSTHRLGGSSNYIGANKLKELCHRAEISKLETPNEREEFYLEIEREHTSVCQSLREINLLH